MLEFLEFGLDFVFLDRRGLESVERRGERGSFEEDGESGEDEGEDMGIDAEDATETSLHPWKKRGGGCRMEDGGTMGGDESWMKVSVLVWGKRERE